MLYLIITGPPGSGKGTQSTRLAKTHNLNHVSTGDLLRKEMANKTDLGLEVADLINRGDLVPDALMLDMIHKVFVEPTACEGILLDGYPRTVPQAIDLDEVIDRLGLKIDSILNLIVPTSVIMERIQHRAHAEGREDDSHTVLQQRLREYDQKTCPTIDRYRTTSTLVVDIDGTAPIDSVTEQLEHVIDSITARDTSNGRRDLSAEEA